jgi:O-antigen/teichoic acid export membrane protein
MAPRRPALLRSLPPVYAAALLRLAFPVLLLPVMAARLGAEEFGRLSLMLVWSGLISTLVEGGFLAAATRLAVRADAAARWALAQQVFSARLVLSLGAALLAAAAGAVLPVGDKLAGAALLAALACTLGWPATWYLQASQQLHRWAWVEIAVYATWAAAVLWLGHGVAAYLALNVVASALLAGLGWRWLKSDLAPAQPLWSRAAVRPGLRMGWTMMPVAIAGAAYSFALPAVASARMPRAELGVYYLADRIVRSVLAAADPVFQLVYPRIVERFGQGARSAFGYTARWAALGALAGAALLLLGWLIWPLARTALHVPQAPVVAAVLAVLGGLLPLLLCWKFFGYWMLGSGRYDRAYRSCMIVGGIAGVAAAALFAERGAVALAWVALSIEAGVILTAIAGIALTNRRRAG